MNALPGSAPVRVVIIMQKTSHLMQRCERTAFTPHTYAVAEGATKNGDEWLVLCIQNSKAAPPTGVPRGCGELAGSPVPQVGGPTVFYPVTHILPPPHTAPSPFIQGGHSSKQVFWDVWNREFQIRKDAMQHKQWCTICRASYARTNQVLRYATCAWLRLLASQVDDRWLNSLEEKGTWVYVAWSTRDGRIYYGETGAKGEIRFAAHCFQAEVADALAFHELFFRKGRKGPTYLRTMARLHPASFCVGILRKVLRTSAYGQEKEFLNRKPVMTFPVMCIELWDSHPEGRVGKIIDKSVVCQRHFSRGYFNIFRPSIAWLLRSLTRLSLHLKL